MLVTIKKGKNVLKKFPQSLLDKTGKNWKKIAKLVGKKPISLIEINEKLRFIEETCQSLNIKTKGILTIYNDDLSQVLYRDYVDFGMNNPTNILILVENSFASYFSDTPSFEKEKFYQSLQRELESIDDEELFISLEEDAQKEATTVNSVKAKNTRNRIVGSLMVIFAFLIVIGVIAIIYLQYFQ